MSRGIILPGNVVNWASPLNRGLKFWGLVLPNRLGGGGLTYRNWAGTSHGTLTNGPTWSGLSHPGGWGSVFFDSNNDLVNTGTRFTYENITVSAWLRLSGTTDIAQIAWGQGAATLLERIGVMWSGDTNLCWVWDRSGAQTRFSWASPDTEWHHVVAIGEGTTRTMFLDGVALSTTSSSGSVNPGTSDTNFFIGGRSSASNSWGGNIDDFRIYNRLLSSSEVAAIYQESLAGHPNTLNYVQTATIFDVGGGGGGGSNLLSKMQQYGLYASSRAA